MLDNPYQQFEKKEITLRDRLAVERTEQANERTLLAYARTALTLIIAGLTFVHFFQKGLVWAIGLAFIPLGLVIAAVGYIRYRRRRQEMRKVVQSGV
jgi:putative membrane protein